MQAQNTRDETTLTQSTPNKAKTMPIQAQNMPNQAQNMPNQAQNTIRDGTKNSPKIHTQSQHSEFWATVKNGRVRLIDLPLTWTLQNKILYGGKHKNLADERLKP